jgi:uncharacterized protein (DUF697 family)
VKKAMTASAGNDNPSSAAAKVTTKKVIKSTAGKTVGKTSKKAVKKTAGVKRTSGISATSSKGIPSQDSLSEHEKALSHFDALAEVVINDAAGKTADMSTQSSSESIPREKAAAQSRAEDVFDAELSKEPPCKLVRVRVTSDRETRAMKIVKTWSQWSVAAGIVPVPLMDVALVSGIQVKMIYDLCKVYDVPFEKKSVLAVASGLVGGSFSAGIARMLGEMALKSIPYVEQVMQPTLSFATTYSMGYVFVKHFESAGTLMNFDASKMNIYFHEQFEKSKKLFSRKQVASA